jgi:uncharacterized protein YodC (DUF2158 family)
MAEFKTGDLVQLKSGGPAMTVRSSDKSKDEYACDWFDLKAARIQLRSAKFFGSQLIKAEEIARRS